MKEQKAIVSTKTGLVLSVFLHVQSSILINVFILVKTRFNGMFNHLYKTCSNRNAAIAMEFFLKMVLFHDLLSTCSCGRTGFPEAPS